MAKSFEIRTIAAAKKEAWEALCHVLRSLGYEARYDLSIEEGTAFFEHRRGVIALLQNRWPEWVAFKVQERNPGQSEVEFIFAFSPITKLLLCGVMVALLVVIMAAAPVVHHLPESFVQDHRVGVMVGYVLAGLFPISTVAWILKGVITIEPFSLRITKELGDLVLVETRIVKNRMVHPALVPVSAICVAAVLLWTGEPLLSKAKPEWWEIVLGCLAVPTAVAYGLAITSKIPDARLLPCSVGFVVSISIGWYVVTAGIFFLALGFFAPIGIEAIKAGRLSETMALVLLGMLATACVACFAIPGMFYFGQMEKAVRLAVSRSEQAQKHDESELDPPLRLKVVVLLMWVAGTAAQFLFLCCFVSFLEIVLIDSQPLLRWFPVEAWYHILRQLLDQSLGGGTHVLSAGTFAKLLIFMVFLPGVVFTLRILWDNYCQWGEYERKRRSNDNAQSAGWSEVDSLVTKICDECDVAVPVVRVDETQASIDARVIIPPLPTQPPILEISRGAVANLSEACRGALIAHEIGHIKKLHVARFSWLHFFSRWSFASEGTLDAIVGSSLRWEAQADKVAFDWLQKSDSREIAFKVMKECFEALKKDRSARAIDMARQHIAIHDSWAMPQTLKIALLEFDTAHFHRRMWITLRLIDFLFFHARGVGYVYLDIDARVDRLRHSETTKIIL